MFVEIKTYQSKSGSWSYTFRVDGKLYGDIGFNTGIAARAAAEVHVRQPLGV